MCTLREIALQCPVCGTWFSSRTVAGQGIRIRTTTDFHDQVEGLEPLAFRVHQCPDCAFAGSDAEFESDAVGAASAAASAGDPPAGSDAGIAGSTKYEAAARLAAQHGEQHAVVGDYLLRAAWCCVAEEDVEAERWFRREAVRAYERALAAYDDVPRTDRAEVAYMIGEQWRRIGDAAQSRAWFERVTDEMTDPAWQGWLAGLATQQREQPREWLD